MAHYLLQIAYTPEAWSTLIRSPQNRLEMVRPVVQRMGGDIEGAWYAFGEYDLVAIFRLPDNVSMAALSLAITAGGACKAIKTTPLMTVEEGIEAMRRAGETGYRPPSG